MSYKQAFTKAPSPPEAKLSKKACKWLLTSAALERGYVLSTARYRNKTRRYRTSDRVGKAMPKRAAAGAKGGLAARRSAARRKREAPRSSCEAAEKAVVVPEVPAAAVIPVAAPGLWYQDTYGQYPLPPSREDMFPSPWSQTLGGGEWDASTGVAEWELQMGEAYARDGMMGSSAYPYGGCDGSNAGKMGDDGGFPW